MKTNFKNLNENELTKTFGLISLEDNFHQSKTY